MNIKKLSNGIRGEVMSDVIRLKSAWIKPKLSVILVWENTAAHLYAKMKQRIGEQLGIQVEILRFPHNIWQETLEKYIADQSADSRIHGIHLESPFPDWLDYSSALECIDPWKDIDGLHPYNLWKLLSWNLSDAIIPATPQACITIIQNQVKTLVGKNIVLIWSWRTVWRPLANLLIPRQATVTVANIHTKNIPDLCRNAEIIVSATGKPGIITDNMVHWESIVIDAWISIDSTWKTRGDVDYPNVIQVAKFVTPVPWWVGMITTWIIFQNLIRAILLQTKWSVSW